VISDSNEDIYFAGYFRQDADLNPNAGTDNYSIGTNQNTFLIKLAWDGAFVWAKTFENGYNSPAALDMDENEDLYILEGYSYTETTAKVNFHNFCFSELQFFFVL